MNTAQVYTVRWRRHGNVECCYRGVVTALDETAIGVCGDEGPEIIRRIDVIELLPVTWIDLS